MNVLILAAGYATRLYPLTLNKAKPLLEVAGKPMMEWVIDNLAPIPGIERVYVVTNNKFANDFQAWADGYHAKEPRLTFEIINDGSTSDADKLGAIGDIHYVLTHANLEGEDLLIVAGDNLFSESLVDFAEFARAHPATVALYDVGDLEQVKKYNAITVDEQGVVTDFVEKPSDPTDTRSGIALYYFRREVVPQFQTYIAEGNNPDQPGRFIEWLHTRLPVHTYTIGGTWFDIGSRETLEEANRIFAAFG